MMIDPVEFAKEIEKVCNETEIVSIYTVDIIDAVILTMRVDLVKEMFIDIFYNSGRGKISFALVNENKRVYGVDNTTRGWHEHPFEEPTRHIPCNPVKFNDFLKFDYGRNGKKPYSRGPEAIGRE